MSQGYPNQESEVLFNVAALAAADTAGTYYYVDMCKFARCSFQYYTGGSGTKTITLEATTQDFATPADAAASAVWTDVSSASPFGAATLTATALKPDATGICGSYTWMRVKLVVASSSTDTYYKLAINKKF